MSGLQQALQLDISPGAREAIEKYMRTENPVAYGTESHALTYFRDWVVNQYETPQLVCLRNDHKYTTKDREQAIKHMRDYFNSEPRYYSKEFEEAPYVTYKNFDKPGIAFKYKCEKYFHDHIGELATHACIGAYGSVKTAILETSTWIELWNCFEEWFEKKRRLFMEKQKNEIEKVTSAEITKRKTPQSHGGVANLLKVLTKTMEKQGADITSIAKMQWAVCKQAGIYIPDEFLSDVAVALDVEGKL